MSEIKAGSSPVSEVEEGGWQLIAGVTVLLGCLSTIGYTVLALSWG